MYSLSAFVTIPALVNNQVGVVSPIGELSAKAKTFSREVGLYRMDDYPNTTLHSFSSVQDGNLVPVDLVIVDPILRIAEFLYARSIDNTLSDDRAFCQQLLVQQFGTTVQFTLVGRMVTNGTYWFPETLTISLINGGENVLKVWFADAAFRSQCDHYEIVVVPPVEPLDDLHGQRAVVLSMLDQLTIPDHLAKVQALTAQYSQTHVISTNYDWTDKNDPTILKATPWTVLVYGNAGNNDDLIREALVTYILANSQWPRSEWEKIYPDLFRPLEFYITPLWDRYSLPNMLTIAGVYSPTVPWREAMRYALATFYGENYQHCTEWLAESHSTYKSLSFVSIGNSKNRNGVFGFEVLWPDYAALSTTHADFARMSLKTQQFSLLLTEMFMHAEQMTPTSDTPNGFSRVRRGDFHYLGKTFNKVLYLVWLKYNDYPEVEVPELPNFGQYRLTVNATGTAGNQMIHGTVSRDGTPGPIAGSIPIDWFVQGDWFVTELQDGDSTQEIVAVVTGSETGSATHTVRAEFLGENGPVSLTAEVTLLPVPVVVPEVGYRLVVTKEPDNAVVFQLWDGETMVEDNSPLIDGDIRFAFEIDTTEEGTDSAVVLTRDSSYWMTGGDDYLLDGQTSTTLLCTAQFTLVGGEVVTLNTPFEVVHADVVIDPIISYWYNSNVDNGQVEQTVWVVDHTNSGSPVRVQEGDAQPRIHLGDGRKIIPLEGDNDAIFTNVDRVRSVIRISATLGGVPHVNSYVANWSSYNDSLS